MTSSSVRENGFFRPQDANGEEGWEAAGNTLQCQTRKTDGTATGAKGCYIVTVENSSNSKPFVVHGVQTADEVRQAVYEYHDKLPNHYVRLDLYDARMGTFNRQPIQNQLPSHTEDLYVRLTLIKHPAIPISAKIERQ